MGEVVEDVGYPVGCVVNPADRLIPLRSCETFFDDEHHVEGHYDGEGHREAEYDRLVFGMLGQVNIIELDHSSNLAQLVVPVVVRRAYRVLWPDEVPQQGVVDEVQADGRGVVRLVVEQRCA